jgi:fatty acid desaturase
LFWGARRYFSSLLVVWVNELLAPLAVVLIANRQRALGNILHDAGHRNLWRDRRRNDLVARRACQKFRV